MIQEDLAAAVLENSTTEKKWAAAGTDDSMAAAD
ncbi:hypothetical protein PR001_g6153 [Phytophthora rubi]|uniref:Uncharacterized protein n=1 Tax=Phytophthora rubi TaxID=129364 RepID=A0A6A3NG31_9STRA|nr:hypothetical protein PR002_g6584 [Phytophthora rubi]KAE9042536.1 hypothetical protein PR001_g6153 [Phytophthora rubi]